MSVPERELSCPHPQSSPVEVFYELAAARPLNSEFIPCEARIPSPLPSPLPLRCVPSPPSRNSYRPPTLHTTTDSEPDPAAPTNPIPPAPRRRRIPRPTVVPDLRAPSARPSPAPLPLPDAPDPRLGTLAAAAYKSRRPTHAPPPREPRATRAAPLANPRAVRPRGFTGARGNALAAVRASQIGAIRGVASPPGPCARSPRARDASSAPLRSASSRAVSGAMRRLKRGSRAAVGRRVGRGESERGHAAICGDPVDLDEQPDILRQITCGILRLQVRLSAPEQEGSDGWAERVGTAVGCGRDAGSPRTRFAQAESEQRIAQRGGLAQHRAASSQRGDCGILRLAGSRLAVSWLACCAPSFCRGLRAFRWSRAARLPLPFAARGVAGLSAAGGRRFTVAPGGTFAATVPALSQSCAPARRWVLSPVPPCSLLPSRTRASARLAVSPAGTRPHRFPGESTWNPLVLRETSPPPPQGRVDAPSPELANLLITLREQQERENQLETQRRQRQAIPMLQRVEETDAGLRAVRIELDRAERVVLETQSQVNVLARTNLVPRELTNSQRVDLSSLRAVVYGMRSVVDGALQGSRLVIAQLRLPPVHSLTRNAARVQLDPPVSRKGLWLTDKRPPDVVSVFEHHVCGICHCVKSHPVSYVFFWDREPF
ncbi:hypothetical protein B0H15DRAFT_957167 [Mycena belliarum]|uniref:Uncharacterized protein n=1 Tax=Mycena belliarum TaxID=1033014 RepID=A0AAD6XIQ7_9AGAR|nr:hypothetical protein B0H15DRAFT_957167 [Mycena belliae]